MTYIHVSGLSAVISQASEQTETPSLCVWTQAGQQETYVWAS